MLAQLSKCNSICLRCSILSLWSSIVEVGEQKRTELMEIDAIGQPVLHPVFSPIPPSFKFVCEHKTALGVLPFLVRGPCTSWLVHSVIIDTVSDLWWATCATVKWITAQTPEAGQHYPAAIYWLSWKMRKELNQTRSFCLMLFLFYLFRTPWRRCCPSPTHKDYTFELLSYKKRKVAQWIHERMAPSRTGQGW